MSKPVDARLVAAAPDMVEALESVYSMLKRIGESVNWDAQKYQYSKELLIVRTALVKAKGKL